MSQFHLFTFYTLQHDSFFLELLISTRLVLFIFKELLEIFLGLGGFCFLNLDSSNFLLTPKNNSSIPLNKLDKEREHLYLVLQKLQTVKRLLTLHTLLPTSQVIL